MTMATHAHRDSHTFYIEICVCIEVTKIWYRLGVAERLNPLECVAVVSVHRGDFVGGVVDWKRRMDVDVVGAVAVAGGDHDALSM